MTLLENLPGYAFRPFSLEHFTEQEELRVLSRSFTLSEVEELILQGTKTSASESIKRITNPKRTLPSTAINLGLNQKTIVYLCYESDFDNALKLCKNAVLNNVELIVGVNKEVLAQLAKEKPNCGLIYCYNTLNENLSAIDRAIRPLIKAHRGKFDIPCIAISGTAGKTTTTDLIRSILEVRNNLFSTFKSQNNIKRTTRHLLNLSDQHSCALFEFGTNGPEQIRVLSGLTQPNITYTTSIGIDHLERISSLEQMLKCETEQYEWMVENVKRQPIFIINIDDPHIHSFYEEKKHLLDESGLLFTVSTKTGNCADFQLNNYEEYFDGRRFITHIEVDTLFGVVQAHVPLIGSHNRANICGAIAASLLSQCASISDVQFGLSNPKFTGKRAEFHITKLGYGLFDETFHSSPHGLQKSLDMIMDAKNVDPQRFNRTCAILGDMGELGEHSKELHIQMGQYAKKVGIDHLIAFGEFSDAFKTGFGSDNCSVFNDKEEVFEYLANAELVSDASKSTLYLLKGGYNLKTHSLVQQMIQFGKFNSE